MSPVPASLLDSLARAGADVVRAGLVVGSGGNLSARVDDSVWVTGAGTWLDRLTRSSFACVDLSRPESVVGRPSSEVALHLATYRARPDVRAIVHLHPQMVLLLDALNERIRLVTTDHAYYLRRIGIVPYLPPGSTALADAGAAAAADGTDCLVLRRHGCSVLGADVTTALRRALNLEEAARLTYRALALGRAAELTDLDPPTLA